MEDLDINAVLQDSMTVVLDAITGALESIAEVMGQVAEALSTGMAESAAATEELQTAVDALAGNVEGLSGAVDASAASMDANTASLDENTSALEENTTAADDNAGAHDAASGSANKAGMALGMVGLAATVAGIATAVYGAKTQDALSIVAALTGANQQQMAQYTSGLETMSQQLGVSMTDAANGLYYVASAGFTGKDALSVLKIAMEGAKAGGADMATVSDALTSSLNAYQASAKDATTYSDIMLEAVTQGKQTFADFAGAVGMAAVTGHTAGFSFAEVAAAEATMTQSGLNAHRSVMELDFLMRNIGLSADVVAGKAKKLGIEGFDTAKFKSDSLIQKLQYLQTITHGNKQQFESLVGGANGLSAAMLLLGKGGSTYNGILDKMHHSSGATANAFKVSEGTMSAHAAHLGASFSVLAYNIAQMVTPSVNAAFNAFASAFSGFASFVLKDGKDATTILGGLAVVIGGVLVAAMQPYVASLWAAATAEDAMFLPILAVAAAIALLVVGVILAYNHIKPFHDAVNAVGAGLRAFWNILQPIGKEIAGQIAPIFRQLGAQLKSELQPAWASLVAAFNTAKPVLDLIGKALGGVIVLAIGILIGALSGLAVGFANFIAGIAQFFAGLVEAVSGIIKLIVDLWSGFFTLIKDLFSGNWSKLGKDARTLLGKLVGDIAQIAHGLWGMLRGIFQAGVGTVVGFVQGFVTGIVGWFTHLWDKLVGHSIVPDLINGIVNWFKSLPGKAIAEVKLLAALVMTEFDSLASRATQWGRNLIQNLINGIRGMAGAVGSAASNVAGTIKNFLGWHSPTKEGPGADADTWMPNLMKMLAGDMTAHTPLLGAAASHAAGTVAGILGAGGSGGLGAGGGLMPAGMLAGVGGLGAGGPMQVTVVLKDETGTGGFMAGARLLDPHVMQLLAQQIAKEMAAQGLLQGRQPIGYTGSR